MFMSGVVKLLSGDPNWWGLTALNYHFLTQPLPTPLAWYAARLPPGLLSVATGAMLVVELGLPFLIFCPRRLRFVAAFGILLLQCCILLTGNYNWFNLQTMLLCLPLLDDAALRRILPSRLLGLLQARVSDAAPRRPVKVVVNALAVLMVFLSLIQMDLRFGGSPPDAAIAIDGWFEPLHLVSPYGLFAVMTTARDEIVIQGSNDGVEWRDYEFRYKPGDVMRRPPWNIPHQPRLDWQMWFAALDDPATRALVFEFSRPPPGERALGDGALGDKPLSRQAADLCAGAVLRLHLRRSRGACGGPMVGPPAARSLLPRCASERAVNPWPARLRAPAPSRSEPLWRAALARVRDVPGPASPAARRRCGAARAQSPSKRRSDCC